MAKPTVFSGVAPSGTLHIGNYIGAISQWVENQENSKSIFCVVDLHAITVPQDPKELKEKVRQVAAIYLACGIDPKKSIVFIQSDNQDHAEMAWIFNCLTPMGWLKKMTQFKEKSEKQKEIVSAGLFTYPALMAADILLYNTDEVPVGEDQIQHVELTRDLAEKFNKIYGKVFKIPKVKILKTGARIMSLQDPESKMSKSDENQNGAIFLLDEPEVVRKKISRAVTDSKKEIEYNPKRAGVYNLINIYAAFSEKTPEQIEKDYAGKGYKEFKEDLTEALVAFLSPIQKKYTEIRKDEKTLDKILADGAKQAREISAKTLSEIKVKLGLK